MELVDVDIGPGCGDPEGCGFVLVIAMGVTLVSGVVSVISEHWIFAVALLCLAMTALFGWSAGLAEKKKKSHNLQNIGAVVCVLGFLFFAAFGVYDYREKQHALEVQAQIQAQVEAEQQRIRAEQQRVKQEEARRIGAFGRFRRWAFGSKPEAEPEDTETEVESKSDE